MRWVAKIAVLALVVSAVAGTFAGAAGAAPGKRTVQARPATHVRAGKPAPAPAQPPVRRAPPRYAVVNSGLLTAPNGLQSFGQASCPARTVVYGGGVFISSGSVSANVNSSYPESDGTHWGGYVNNAGGFDTQFEVYAICGKRNAKWSIQSFTLPNPAGAQTGPLQADCPSGTQVLGGGGFSSSGSLDVNLNTSYGVKTGKGASAIYYWATFMNNNRGRRGGRGSGGAACRERGNRAPGTGRGRDDNAPAGRERDQRRERDGDRGDPGYRRAHGRFSFAG